jgi:hypothetical protein
MAGGRFDSSLTRVQPVFNQLYKRNTSGRQWLLPLLALGSRSSESDLPAAAEWSGNLTRPPEFEFKVLSPADYLNCLVRTPGRMCWPIKGGEPQKFDDETTLNRQALLRGDSAALQDALRRLAKSRQPGRGRWWVFEGKTNVDCALFAEGVTVFIEGKRTEPSLTDSVEWDPKRTQLCRNLDCLRALEGRAARYFVLLIIEQGTPLCGQAATFDRDFDGARNSWPHLDDPAARALLGHYLGYTTWQRVRENFRDWSILLPGTADDAIQAGLARRKARRSDGPLD